LPLRIFEERYRELLAEVLANDSEFVVVRGRDTGIVNVGCTARVEQLLRQYEDGRCDILARGVRRVRILDIDQERSFLRGRVDEVEDEEPPLVAPERAREAVRLYRLYAEATGAEVETPHLEDPALSFVLGVISDELEFRQVLLGTLSEAQRIEMVIAHLNDSLARRAREVEMRAKAATNGHSRHWKD
jgi:Lon protease-like protein